MCCPGQRTVFYLHCVCMLSCSYVLQNSRVYMLNCRYSFCQLFFTSLQLGFNIIQSISSIGEHFSKLKLGFINFPKRINKVMKTFQHNFIFNDLDLFSPIVKCLQQFSFWLKQFCFFLFNNCKCFQHSIKQLNNL